jgi:hypothetical protein
MGASTKRRPSARWATPNGFSGADRHYTDGICFTGADRPLPGLIILLGVGLVVSLGAFVFCMLLTDEIRREGITFFDVAIVVTAMVFNFFPGPICRALINDERVMLCIPPFGFQSWPFFSSFGSVCECDG